MSNKKDKAEDVTVSKVYDTLKSGPFLRDLYWDVLSYIKEKSTFKCMRETIDNLLNKKSEVLTTLSDNEQDNVLRKTIVAEICSMSYAVDTVFSKILFMKLKKAYRSQIFDIVKDLRDDGKIPDDIWSKLLISNNSQCEDSIENTINNSAKQKAETSVKSTAVFTRRKQKEILCSEGNKKVQQNHKDVPTNNVQKVVSKKKTQARNQVPKKNTPVCLTSTSKKELPGKSKVYTNAKSTKVNETHKSNNALQDGNQDSDAESEISVGNLSLASVSSVHTSDLSSFDDEISLSSDDEVIGTKKRLSLKDLQKIYQNDNSSSKSAEKLNGTKLNKSPGYSKALDTVANAAASSGESVIQSPVPKELPKRVRKPNSKYSSDNILCQFVKVKDRKKHSPVSTKDTSEKNSSDEFSPKKKRARIETSDMEIVTNEVQKIITDKEKIAKSDTKSLPQHCDASDMYKSHSAVRSLTSRRTAPVTLYSTAA